MQNFWQRYLGNEGHSSKTQQWHLYGQETNKIDSSIFYETKVREYRNQQVLAIDQRTFARAKSLPTVVDDLELRGIGGLWVEVIILSWYSIQLKWCEEWRKKFLEIKTKPGNKTTKGM